MPARRFLTAVPLIAALVCSMGAPLAQANPTQFSVMMDDDRLVYRTDKVRDQTMLAMKKLGVDCVRVTVLWSVVADRARSTPAAAKAFRRYGAASPRAYPHLNWNRYDGIVRTAQALGMTVYFDVTGPGPSWGHEKAPRSERSNQRTWKPKPAAFKQFVEAVGRRYSGKYRDEDTRHTKLPKVGFWTLWNEPNQGGWLTPQFLHGKPYSQTLYRRLYIAGHQALQKTGHGKDLIMLGETAPLGNGERTERSPMYPKTFLEHLFCVNGAGNPVHESGCSDFTKFGPLQAKAYAHHPYTKYNAPTKRDSSPLAYTMANVGDLEKFLDLIATKTGRIAKGLPIALTEFGYETNPPDPYHGIPLALQAQYSNDGDFLSWSDPRIITQTQFLLRDVAPIAGLPKSSKHRWFTYQSGLYYQNGKAKPSAAAYRFPFEVFPYRQAPDGGVYYAFWGQTRFRPNGSIDNVYLQFKPQGSSKWTTFGRPVRTAGTRNYFVSIQEVPRGAGQLRATWGGSTAPYIARSRAISVH